VAPNEILKLYKQIGETPLECIYRFKEDHPEYGDAKMTYLGRLDPMAEGLLLVLANGTIKKDDFLLLNKTYEFEVLWGFSTDTYDILGKIVERGDTPKKLENKMPDLLKKIGEKKTQSYPAYSSRTVAGKPLFEWARENKINEIDIPTRGIKIFSIDHLNTRYVSGHEILTDVTKRISLVKGDFRQQEILKDWEDSLSGELDEMFLISSFVADVSSGTYIRGLANDMGNILGTAALAYSIKRTHVGEYTV
jgi:tRNA pseudouridine(55) synthase